jgi:hypothetical protein
MSREDRAETCVETGSSSCGRDEASKHFPRIWNVPKSDLTSTVFDVVDCNHVAHDRFKWQAAVKTVLQHQVVRDTEFVGDLRACKLLETGCN